MSTQSERYQKHLIEGINRAYSDLTVDGKPLLVRALERHVKTDGLTFASSTGFSLTIGDRVAHFSPEGRYIETAKAPVERSEQQWAAVRDKRPGAYSQFCRGTITEDELFAEVAEAVKELVQPIAEKPQPAGAKK